MASLEKMKAAQKKSEPTKDVELAVRMTIKMLRDGGGMKVIADAINQSNDPAQVVGQFLAQIVGQLAEKLDAEFGIDPRIFLAEGGWLEHILNYIEDQLGYPEEFSDEIYAQVLETIKAAAIGGRQPQPAPQGQPAPPQEQAVQAQPMGLGG